MLLNVQFALLVIPYPLKFCFYTYDFYEIIKLDSL